MQSYILRTKDIPRKRSFPFRVQRVFYCNDTKFSHAIERTWNDFEVCIRISSNLGMTEDYVNGERLKLPCPNVVWRLPGSRWKCMPTVRNVISFSYSPDLLEDMEYLGMKAECPGWSFNMTSEMEALIAKFRRLACNLYTPGVSDALDWLCFNILGTLMLRENDHRREQTMEERVRNASLWFNANFAENINIDDVATENGMSHTCFFKNWKRIFDVSPSQYIINLRLEAAARLLRESNLPISAIVNEVHFAGQYMFYKRFQQKYGMTPAEYRKRFCS